MGKDKETSEIEEAMKNQKPNQCATLVYTVSHIWLWCYPDQMIFKRETHAILLIHVFLFVSHINLDHHGFLVALMYA